MSTIASAAPAPDGGLLPALIQQILTANPDPQDALDITAALESFGWTDRMAVERLAMPDLFAVGQALFPEVRAAVRVIPGGSASLARTWRLLLHVVAQLPHGLAFALPMIISVGAMITLHISLMAYDYFTVAQATALALAIFLSFVGTGGFVQAMANSLNLFLNFGEPRLARSVAWLLQRRGIATAVGVAVAAVLLDLVIPVMPLDLMIFMGLYTVLMSCLWLSFAALYVLRREEWLALITAAGVILVYVLWQSGVSVILAQAITLCACSLAALAVSAWLLTRATDTTGRRERIVRPRNSQLAYVAAPYFAYGVLYFTFVFVDRLVSWSTNSTYMPYYIWFRGDYELGMDWALLSLILPLGAVEVLIHYFVGWLQAANQRVLATHKQELVRGLWRLYLRCLGTYAAVALASFGLMRLVVDWAQHIPLLASATPTSNVEPYVFTWAALGYVLLAAALFNVLIMFSLLHPAPALRLMVLAIAVDFVVGLVLTRVTVAYQMAVWGMVAGAAFLFAATTLEMRRLLPDIDFLLFRLL